MNFKFMKEETFKVVHYQVKTLASKKNTKKTDSAHTISEDEMKMF